MHAAIMAVNQALEKDDSAETLAALRNPNTCLVKVEGDNIERYQTALVKAKGGKAVKAQVRASLSLSLSLSLFHSVLTTYYSTTAVVRVHDLLPIPLMQAVNFHSIPLVVKGHELVEQLLLGILFV